MRQARESNLFFEIANLPHDGASVVDRPDQIGAAVVQRDQVLVRLPDVLVALRVLRKGTNKRAAGMQQKRGVGRHDDRSAARLSAKAGGG